MIDDSWLIRQLLGQKINGHVFMLQILLQFGDDHSLLLNCMSQFSVFNVII